MAAASGAQVATGLLTGGQAVGSAVSQVRDAGATTAAADFNTKLADLQSRDAILRGNVTARTAEVQSKQIVGRARASLAAQGVALDSGSALDVQVQDAGIGALDAQMIRNNAAREAWGITTEDTLQRLSATQRAASLRADAVQTLATGAARTYGIFAKHTVPGLNSGNPGKFLSDVDTVGAGFPAFGSDSESP